MTTYAGKQNYMIFAHVYSPLFLPVRFPIGNTFPYQSYGNTNKGSGYLPNGTLVGQNMNQGMLDTTSDPLYVGDDKWSRWFGTPPYTSFQRGKKAISFISILFLYFYSSILIFFICVIILLIDNYADLGHENYQVIPFFLYSSFFCNFILT